MARAATATPSLISGFTEMLRTGETATSTCRQYQATLRPPRHPSSKSPSSASEWGPAPRRSIQVASSGGRGDFMRSPA
jgi:hypothetical protein